MGHSWILSDLYDEQISMCWQQVGSCASKHNWPITIYLTDHARFMNCRLLVGRRWRNIRQRPLVLNICKCREKAQWVTVTLTDNSVKGSPCQGEAFCFCTFFSTAVSCGRRLIPFHVTLISTKPLFILTSVFSILDTSTVIIPRLHQFFRKFGRRFPGHCSHL